MASIGEQVYFTGMRKLTDRHATDAIQLFPFSAALHCNALQHPFLIYLSSSFIYFFIAFIAELYPPWLGLGSGIIFGVLCTPFVMAGYRLH